VEFISHAAQPGVFREHGVTALAPNSSIAAIVF
jgi:hypothetical protein